METIRVKELIGFRAKSDQGKKNFAHKLKYRKPKGKNEKGSGGDYWITSTSCIYNVFKDNNKDLYTSKIDELFSKIESTDNRQTKTMFQKNIDILNNFLDFEYENLIPKSGLRYEKMPKSHKTIYIRDFPIFVNPDLLYSFGKKGERKIGAIWLIAQLNGFRKAELGMFCETLHKFLIKNYSDSYEVIPEFCIAIDTFNAQKLTYLELLNGNIPFLVEETLREIEGH